MTKECTYKISYNSYDIWLNPLEDSDGGNIFFIYVGICRKHTYYSQFLQNSIRIWSGLVDQVKNDYYYYNYLIYIIYM